MGNCFAPSKVRRDVKTQNKMQAVEEQEIRDQYANYNVSNNMLNEQLMDEKKGQQQGAIELEKEQQ